MNKMMKYIIGGFLFIIVVLLLKALLLKKREGMTNITGASSDDTKAQEIEKMVKQVKSETTQMIDGMHLVKYRKDWEDLIIAIEAKINAITLTSLPTLAKKLEDDDSNIVTVIENLNTLNKFRGTLNENMKHLDGLKS
jgi:divalent metal cation (Fe/Co/Zn/Cd) transporter